MIWQVGLLNGLLTGIVVVAAFVATAAAIVLTSGAAVALIPFLSSVGVGTVVVVSTATAVAAGAYFSSNVLPDDLFLPVYQITPGKIFSNEVLLFDVDFFNPKDSEVAKDEYGNILKDEMGNEVELESTAKQLRNVVSNWYTILRDIAIVALLSILIYIGIRVILSSTSKDKAKYKQMLTDWIVAICLLFVMQYIMAFSNLVVSKITDLIKTTEDSQFYIAVIDDGNGKIEKQLNEANLDGTSLKTDNNINWKTDLVGWARLQAQINKEDRTTFAGYSLIFVVLVLYTIYFIFTYLKRVLYMAFLTIIAPLVALTYPIDKINDGKAQAFDMWFKEYIFNLLIQPMHLLLYTILVTSAFELASENIIYSLVAIGFMIPSEKLMRRFFGFEKAHTPGLLAGPAGAAMTMSAVNKMFSKGGKGSDKLGSGGNSKSSDSESSDKPPRTNSNFDKDAAFFGDGDSSEVEPRTRNSNSSDNGDSNNGTNQREDNNFPRNDTDEINFREPDYMNDDNIYDLSEDEYSIRDADTPLLPMNNDTGTQDNNNYDSNSDNLNTPLRFSNMENINEDRGKTDTDKAKFNGIDYMNDDNIYDLSQDQYSIRDANTSKASMNNNESKQNGNYYNGSDAEEAPLRVIDSEKFNDMNEAQNYKNPHFNDVTSGNSDSSNRSTGNVRTNAQNNNTQQVSSNTSTSQRSNSRVRKSDEASKKTISKPTLKQRAKGKGVEILRNVKSYAPATKYYAKGLADKATNRIKNAHPLKTGMKVAGGLAAGAVAGSIGLAAGIASGDATKAFQYTTGASLSGYKFGKGRTSDMQQTFEVEGIDEKQERLKYKSDDEYKDAKQKEYVKNYQKNVNNQFELEKTFGKNEAKRIMKEDVPKLLENGINDISDIKNIEKAIKNDDINVSSLDKAISLHKYSSLIGDFEKEPKKEREWRNKLTDKYSKKKEFEGRDHEKMTDDLFKDLEKYNRIRYK